MDDMLGDHSRNARPDAALMRRLAGDYAPAGMAVLGLERRTLRRLEAILGEVPALRCGERAEDDALRMLDSQAALATGCARRAVEEGGQRLPAWQGRPRIEVALEALCDAGGAALTERRLLEAIGELDACQALTMAELWSVPEALRTVLSRATASAAESAVARARRRLAARRWALRPSVRAVRLDDAFLEQALKLSGEANDPRARAMLDAVLSRRGIRPEAAVARAQAGRSDDALRLEQLSAARRMVDALDWQACFQALSRVDRELCGDPAAVYPRMEESSRAAVREQVALIARRLGAPELAVARSATDAARAGNGLRGGVCWWLYDDRGRRELLERMGRGGARLRRIVPDPSGRLTISALLGLTTLTTALLTACAGGARFAAVCLPLGWCAAGALAGRIHPRLFRPARLLKLELEEVPDEFRTLVTMPVLLSSPERAAEACDQLEALGCLETDGNIDYLLLGDFADAPRRSMPGDGAILHAARARIAEMNARAGREKYALLCRPRRLLAADGVYMGRDRKRGALADLNRLLLGREGSEAAFGAEGDACPRLKGRFACVITLDADTRMLPGEARRLIGAMAHPLNRPGAGRGYAVLQPAMQTLPSACTNAFVKLFSGAGGVSAYPVEVSNLWQDLTGRGIYGGKGIYDVAAFQGRLEGALPEGRVLSHDLIEGAIAGAGFVGDVTLYDGCPKTLGSALARLHRWTRGDWQLLPLMLSAGPLPGGGALTAADRFRMLDNLMRPLRAPAQLLLLLFAAWTGSGGALLAALAVDGLEALPGRGRSPARRRAAEVAILPALAWNALDAVVRTLWRLLVSGRRLMEWVTAADAESKGPDGRAARLPGRVAALLLTPGLLARGWTPAALALIALFLVAPGWIADMEAEAVGAGEAAGAEARAAFLSLARDTWRFFQENVPFPGGPALPPDNVQSDPPVGAARRTSPTNIALYLLGCLSACRLGFIDRSELRGRMGVTLDALEELEKWRGQLYNWYDIDTRAPLRPRYVSSVDSGNLAAALLLCAGAAEPGAALCRRFRALARGMDLAALYDGRRELFYIGADADRGRFSEAHYDLLASESRILSYTAMMLGQVPARHWRRLGRSCAGVAGGVAPLSWGGTMFEYLMPELLMPAPRYTLLGEGVRAAVAAQAALGRRQGRPWGVSESGYGALDAALNYQYRAFGLRELALNGEAGEDVVAPYASMLAAAVAPAAAARNLAAMEALGWRDRWGLFEAADYRRAEADGAPALVASHMAHHQGMILCALCNALTGNSLAADFMRQPEARALSLLLEEGCAVAPAAGSRRAALRRNARRDPCDRSEYGLSRRAAGGPPPDTHLLYGGGATALCTADGAAHYRRGGVDATRFSDALEERQDGARSFLADLDSGAWAAFGMPQAAQARFGPGVARFGLRLGRLEAELSLCLSPEDGTLLRVVEVRNAGDRPARCAVTDVVPVALAAGKDWRAHAVFQNLFVQSERLADGALLFSRRPGSRGAEGPVLAHLIAGPGEISADADYGSLAGRMADPGAAGVAVRRLSGGIGMTLNPAGALRATLRLAPGGRARLYTALSLLDGEADARNWLARWRQTGRPERALRLSELRARAMLGFIGLGAREHDALQRMAALLADGTLAARARGPRRGEAGVLRSALWALGVSGDRPILAMSVTDAGHSEAVRALIRAHGFYRAAGLEADLVLLDDGEPGYARPVRDMLEGLVSASHLNCLRGEDGGARLIDGATLEGEGRRALRRFCAAFLESGREFTGQVFALLAAAAGSCPAALTPMDAGAPALKPVPRLSFNGYGGFLPGGGYAIDVLPDRLPPAPWCNLLANERGGTLLSERGGGFFWAGSSRTARLTPYGNDSLREGFGIALALVDDRRGETLSLLPGEKPAMPFRVVFDAHAARYTFENSRAAGEVCFSMAPDRAETRVDITLENRALRGEELRLTARVNWLMGEDRRDAVALNGWQEGGACLATGAMAGAGYFAAADAFAQAEGREGFGLRVPLRLKRGERRSLRLALGWEADVSSARARVRALRDDVEEAAPEIPAALTVDTPDAALNLLVNGFLRHQVRASRVFGRTGLYQPGGAWGFRDQLQDMLALLHDEPGRVREHLLRCAARQFEAGDVLHWWHEPFTGVRTRVSDDMLFLPWVTAAYVKATGDAGVLDERVAYLKDAPIPEGREDVYRAMEPGERAGTLHEHCMRAFRRAARAGGHGLLLMGSGDWNDGMNRVGAAGRGESVWLSEFAIACADSYRPLTSDPEERAWLWALGERLRLAVEAHGWDGGWYLRAYDDGGLPLGGAAGDECRIDAVAQAWAVLAGLDDARCRAAMDAAWRALADEEAGVIRLLTPPFEGRGTDPGYIRGYPPGVRENGGQYTHGALWLLLALIRMGDAGRAHRALRMLLPFNHSDTPEKARRYRVEPYVMAADVYDRPGERGRGGWTWYTGAAGWMFNCVLALLGYERRGDAVRLGALLGDWPSAAVVVPFGRARYRLVCDKKTASVTLDGVEIEGDFIRMIDDGGAHEARFPARKAAADG